jgi:hypothetical protein
MTRRRRRSRRPPALRRKDFAGEARRSAASAFADALPAAVTAVEMRLLKYLREHSGRWDQSIWLDPGPVARGLGISANQLREESATLAARGLIGLRDFRPNANDVPSQRCAAIWLTRKGKEYLWR